MKAFQLSSSTVCLAGSVMWSDVEDFEVSSGVELRA